MLFAYRLAIELGYLRPTAMLQRMTAEDLMGWVAYFSIEPFGAGHRDWLIAQLTTVVNNRWRGKEEEPAELWEFLPYAEQPVHSDEEVAEGLRKILGRGSRSSTRRRVRGTDQEVQHGLQKE